ncbi:unnamed protein product, partial [Ixodes hexagonus]
CYYVDVTEPKFCLSPTVESPKEEGPEINEMDVGIIFLCDQDFVVAQNREGQPTLEEYVRTLANAAQLRFMDVTEIRVVLHLVAVRTIRLGKQLRDYVRLDTGRLILKAGNILSYVKHHFGENKVEYEEGDVILFISGEQLLRNPREPKMWTGGPKIGGACGDERVAVVYDDGRSFLGAGDVAQAVAFLLGATRDTLYSPSHSRVGLGFLTSTIGGGPMYGFSPDSKQALLQYYQNNKEKSCWKEPPSERLILNDTVVLPANFFDKYSLPYSYPCFVKYRMHPCTVRIKIFS